MADAQSSLIILAQATAPAAPAGTAAATAAAPAKAEAALAAGTEQPAEKGPFPPFDVTYFPSSLLWLVITFVVLYFVIGRVAIPRLSSILEARRGRIEADIKTAERMKAESAAAAAGYEKSLAEARAGGAKIAEAARGKARAAADAKRSAIESSLSAKLASSETEIARIKAQALAEVGTVARDAAGAIVKALAGVDVPSREIDEAVDKSMAR